MIVHLNTEPWTNHCISNSSSTSRGLPLDKDPVIGAAESCILELRSIDRWAGTHRSCCGYSRAPCRGSQDNTASELAVRSCAAEQVAAAGVVASAPVLLAVPMGSNSNNVGGLARISLVNNRCFHWSSHYYLHC